MVLQASTLTSTEALVQSMIMEFPCWFLLVMIVSFSFFGYVGMPLSPGKQRTFFVTDYCEGFILRLWLSVDGYKLFSLKIRDF